MQESATQPFDAYGPADPFYVRAMELVDAALLTATALTAIALLVVVAEGVASRRRAYASLVAAGVPRWTLARSILWQALLPAVPAILIAVAAGIALARALGTDVAAGGFISTVCDAAGANCRTTIGPTVTMAIPVPWADLARTAGAAVLAVLATTGLGLLFLRSSTELSELRTT